MSAWSLLFVPASLGMIVLLLATISWIEQQVLSPRAMIVHTARSSKADPEHVETFVADQTRMIMTGLAAASNGESTGLVEVAAEHQ